jgi:hypothetical protein
MASIGAFESAREKEKHIMVANSNNSRQSVKRPTRKTKPNITPAEAAQILQSAIAYLNGCGLSVTGHNDGDALLLRVEGINYENGKIITL